MSLRDDLRAKSAGLVKRETVLLPECGLEVQIRGLMAGEVQRAGEAKRKAETQAAYSAEDPATSKLLWNPLKSEDLDEIALLHTVDLMTILEASNRLSGLEKLEAMGKASSQSPKNGSSPLPPDSAEPSGS